jgi:hypothetical protein
VEALARPGWITARCDAQCQAGHLLQLAMMKGLHTLGWGATLQTPRRWPGTEATPGHCSGDAPQTRLGDTLRALPPGRVCSQLTLRQPLRIAIIGTGTKLTDRRVRPGH